MFNLEPIRTQLLINPTNTIPRCEKSKGLVFDFDRRGRNNRERDFVTKSSA
jgi:hypothetical protein